MGNWEDLLQAFLPLGHSPSPRGLLSCSLPFLYWVSWLSCFLLVIRKPDTASGSHIPIHPSPDALHIPKRNPFKTILGLKLGWEGRVPTG
ncbi:hypothetical protein ACRRTK_000865 [Alexandromys fortis]